MTSSDADPPEKSRDPQEGIDYDAESLRLHAQHHGKLAVASKVSLDSSDDLSVAYTPGVAAPCEAIAADPARARELTIKGNTVAVVSDGSAVLGLGNIGALGALPVMEGKCVLFKEYADIDAWPICLDTQSSDEIVETVRRIAPVFGGINLEDIAAPRCFEIEAQLQDLGIPVFHDDQHGTAIVLLAALMNAAKVVNKKLAEMTVVINGAGSAGTAIARLLRCIEQDPAVCTPVGDIIVCDREGALHVGMENLSEDKRDILRYTNRDQRTGCLQDVLDGADAFVGVSAPDLLGSKDIARMADGAIVFPMALEGGAAVVGTGRSDFPNQVNNVLAFPGIFRGALDCGASRITQEMKIAAAHALAAAVPAPTADRVLPSALDRSVAPLVAAAVANCSKS